MKLVYKNQATKALEKVQLVKYMLYSYMYLSPIRKARHGIMPL